MPVFVPQPAHAYDFYEPDLGIGTSEVCPGMGLTRRIMPCIKETLINVTNEMLIPISEYMALTVTAACTLAIALLGVAMLGGRTTAPFKDSLLLMVKLGCVSMFSYNFGGIFPLVLDSMDELLGIVTTYVIFSGSFADSVLISECPDLADLVLDPPGLQVWDAVDCSINSLIGGIFSPFSLSMGIVGFIFSCFMSNTLGVMIGMLGIRLLLQLMWAIVRSLYIFVGSYIGLCLMVLISPFFIPTLLFQVTRGYFERWLRITMSFMLQPVILFAYLAMLLTAFDLIIFSGPNSLYGVLAGDNVDDEEFRLPWEEGGEGGIGGFLMSHGGYAVDHKSPWGVNINSKGASENPRIKAAFPKSSIDTGVGGIMGAKIVTPTERTGGMSIDRNRQRAILDSMGLGMSMRHPNPDGSAKQTQLNYFEFSVPVETVDWAFLADQNGFDSSNPDDLVRYMVKVYISFLMALITGYVFIELLDTLPFIGSGLAMGSGIVDEKSLGMSGLTKHAPPGNDFMKGVKGA